MHIPTTIERELYGLNRIKQYSFAIFTYLTSEKSLKTCYLSRNQLYNKAVNFEI